MSHTLKCNVCLKGEENRTGSGELQTWNGHFDMGVYIDYTLEPLQSERHIEGTKDEASQSGSRIDEDTTIEIEDIEEENNSDQDESHRVDYMLAAGWNHLWRY